MKVQRFEFEGEQRTAREIRLIVTCLSNRSIRNHIAAGRNTRTAMLTFNPITAIRAGAQRGKHAMERIASVEIGKARVRHEGQLAIRRDTGAARRVAGEDADCIDDIPF